MDDYMIKSVGSSSSGHISNDESSSYGSEESGEEKEDKLNQVMNKIEGFYSKKYKNYHVFQNKNILTEKVWNLYYDQKVDIIYIFIAKVRHLNWYKCNTIGELFGLNSYQDPGNFTHFSAGD